MAKAKAKRNGTRVRFTSEELDRLLDALARPESSDAALIEKLDRMYDDAVASD